MKPYFFGKFTRNALALSITALALTTLTLPPRANAAPKTYVTTIEHITPNAGLPGYRKAIVWFGDGRVMQIPVYSLESKDLQDRTMTHWLKSESRNFWQRAKRFRVVYEEDTILSIEPTRERLTARSTPTWDHMYSQYSPTVFNSEAEVQPFMDLILKEPVRSSSECWQRAHYWGHSLWRDYSVKSNKTFIFYSEVYRDLDEEEDSWKFHVAPSVTMANGDEMVIDGEFNPIIIDSNGIRTRKPMPRDEWSQQFVKPNRPCVHLDSYAEFKRRDKSRENEFCYLVTVPMYYWGPDNLDSGRFAGIVDSWEAYSVKKTCKAIKASQCGRWTFENEDLVTKWKRARAKKGVEWF